MIDDTICALSTAWAEGGIGIIRVSGKESLKKVSDHIISRSGKYIDISKTHTVKYGYFCRKDKKIIDEVLVSTFLGPKSFTAEDTVEISCHGGIFIMKSILECLMEDGIRMAEPGEFTKRAFLNGRIDLSQAESVSSLIKADSEKALEVSLKQLKGDISKKIRELRAVILENNAFIEASLDDPEHISLDDFRDDFAEKINHVKSEIMSLYNTSDNGIILEDGVKAVILGKPNAGKSSLLNLLTGSKRAIITDIPGTTRDTIEERVRINNTVLKLIDTAGLRKAGDIIEEIGIQKALEKAREAGLIIFMMDVSEEPEIEEDVLDILKEKNTIILINKIDMYDENAGEDYNDIDSIDEKNDDNLLAEGQESNENISRYRNLREYKTLIEEKLPGKNTILFSTKTGTGVQKLKDTIENMFYSSLLETEDGLVITNIRHRECLKNAGEALERVLDSFNKGLPEDFFTIDLMDAYKELGFIIGEELREDLQNEIFSKFCMGK